MSATKFVGRASELADLAGFLSKTGPAIGVIYGRRRIDKSLLIEKALEGRPALTFEGLENRPKKDQIEAFLFQLSRQAGPRSTGEATRSWAEALYRLRPVLEKRPACIVLDEFQWMANYRREIVSDLKMIWDQYLSRIPGVKLILCGSIASFMTSKVVRSSALHGRVDLEMHLKGLDLAEARELLRGKGLDEVIEACLYFGGVPKYLELLRDHPSVRMAVAELAFRENGYFLEEYDRIFTSHFKRNPDFRKISLALAGCPEGLFRKQLAEKAGVAAAGVLSEHLADLEAAGFISSVIPVDKSEGSRLIKYYLSDAYMRFYFAFIRPNLKKIKSGAQPGMFAQLSQTGRFHAWRGKAFESLCIRHARLLAEILGFSGIDFSFGPYWRAPSKARPGLQIDLLFDRADNVMTLCEMKCSVARIGMRVVTDVERKVELLQRAFPKKTVQRVLVVHGEPSRDLVRSGAFFRIIKAAELASSPVRS
ncbi:MAG: ATP-binding protein [Planctomycetota bacterium]